MQDPKSLKNSYGREITRQCQQKPRIGKKLYLNRLIIAFLCIHHLYSKIHSVYSLCRVKVTLHRHYQEDILLASINCFRYNFVFRSDIMARAAAASSKHAEDHSKTYIKLVSCRPYKKPSIPHFSCQLGG